MADWVVPLRIGYVTLMLLERGCDTADDAEARALADVTATQDRQFELGEAMEYHKEMGLN